VQVYVGSAEKCSVKLHKHVEVMNAAGMKAASASVIYTRSQPTRYFNSYSM